MKKVLFLLLSLVLVLSLNSALMAGDVIKWKMQSAYPPGDATYDVHSMEAVKLIESMSGGKVKIELFPPGALCAVPEMANAVSQGMIDMAAVYGPFYAGSVPVGDVDGGLPFTWTSMDQVAELYWDPKYRLIDVIRQGWDKKNVFYLVPNACGSYPFLFKFPVNKLDELKGHKIRAAGAAAEWFRKAGASPVSLPGGEIYMAMKLGTIEGTPFPPMILETLKLKEVVDYIIFPGFVTPPQTCIIINKDAWNALPKDLREKLTNDVTLIDFYKANGKAYQARDDQALETAYKAGIKKIVLPEEEMKKARTMAIEIWENVGKKDQYSGEAVDILKRYMNDKNMM